MQPACLDYRHDFPAIQAVRLFCDGGCVGYQVPTVCNINERFNMPYEIFWHASRGSSTWQTYISCSDYTDDCQLILSYAIICDWNVLASTVKWTTIREKEREFNHSQLAVRVTTNFGPIHRWQSGRKLNQWKHLLRTCLREVCIHIGVYRTPFKYCQHVRKLTGHADKSWQVSRLFASLKRVM
jgi:hypothetical protein